MLTVGSLFSGVGGLELGLERTGGFKTIWQCEIDPYATKILEKHWPDVKRYGDIRTVHGESSCEISDTPSERLEKQELQQRLHSRKCSLCLSRVDLVCGGFLCQDISVANPKGKGLEGARSGLWFEFARIIGEIRPKYALIENVPNLRSKGLSRVLCDLAKIGYDAEWDSLRASDFGYPHRRERIFIIAIRQDISDSFNEGLWSCGGGNNQTNEKTCRGRNINRKRSSLDGWFNSETTKNEDVADSTSIRCGQGGDTQREYENNLVEIRSTPQNQQPRRGWVGGIGKSGQIMGNASINGSTTGIPEQEQWKEGNTEIIDNGNNRIFRRTTPGDWIIEPELGRVADGISNRVDRLKCIGNAVVPACAEWIGRMIWEYDKELPQR